MDLQGPTAEHGRFEQIVSQFLLKSLHVILDSRIPSIHHHGRSCDLSSAAPVKKSDRWFGLVLGDRPPALDNLNFWHRNLLEPMIIDIILVQEMPSCSSSGYNLSAAFGSGKSAETILERWVVQYEYSKAMLPQVGESSTSYKKIYKKSSILLHSLYSMMRLLPAYRAFRKLSSSNQACDFDINYKVFQFSAPFSREEEKLMKKYSFCPADAPQGRFSISVMYCENLSDLNLETSTSFPPQIITDYVGSPAADPFRAFPSSNKGVCATSFPLQGKVVPRSPSSVPYQRPHSWTSGLHGVSPLMGTLSGSPPVYSTSTMPFDSLPPSTDVFGHRTRSYGLSTHHKSTSFDDYQLSPPFSPSPSSSSPSCPPSDNHIQTHHLSETAPVSIPHPMMGRSPRHQFPNLSDPSRHPLPPLSPRSTRLDTSSHDSLSGIRMLKKSESSRIGELNSGVTNQYLGPRVLKDSKDDFGRFSGLLSSSSSPRIGFSRSSSRLSLLDDLDDDFSCPFIVDDVDISDSAASQNLDEKEGSEFSSQTSVTARKSQDASVGALVHMLRTAPPLHQDSSCYSSRSLRTEYKGEAGTASGFFLPRKTSDSLEELKCYREMKELLLSKSGSGMISKKA